MYLLFILILFFTCFGCGPRYSSVTVKGTITDSVTHAPIARAFIQDFEEANIASASDANGSFTLQKVEVRKRSFIIEADRYRKKEMILSLTGADSVENFDFVLKRIPDTAYTSQGPVDASFFLSDSLLKRKRLSKNEARRIVLQEITGGKIIGAEMIKEKHQLLWVFDIQHGKDFITILVDAYSGKIVSTEGTNANQNRTKSSRYDADQ